jgi:hypothetical protein
MHEIGIEKFSIVLIRETPCLNRSHLEAQEFEVMAACKKEKVELYNFHTTTERVGSQINCFKRGSVCRCTEKARSARTRKKCGRWSFSYRKNGKQISKSFSVSVYGEEGAKKMAEAQQELIYPSKPHVKSSCHRSKRKSQ